MKLVNESILVAPLKRFIKVQSGEMISADEELPEGFPIVGGNGVRGYTDKFNVKGPALVIGRVGANCGNVHLINEDFWASEHAFVVYPKKEVSLGFLKAMIGSLNLNNYAIKTAQPLLNTTIVEEVVGYFPPFEQQESISNFLEKETAHIDKLIATKKKLINVLSEKRLLLITQAVTRGLNSKVKMKDSGIDWLGEIPEHWEVKKIKHISKLKSGEFITADSISENDTYDVYGGNGLRGYTSDKTHDGEFVLIGRQGALCGNINYVKGEFWASEHAVVCNPIKKYEIIWFGELLRIMNLNQYSAAAAQPGLSVEVISNLSIPFPPRHEQKLISEYIIEHLQKIDNIISASEKSIDLLKERKSVLITEAVTGQLNIS